MDMECITSQPLEEIKMNKKTKGKKREKVCVWGGIQKTFQGENTKQDGRNISKSASDDNRWKQLITLLKDRLGCLLQQHIH